MGNGEKLKPFWFDLAWMKALAFSRLTAPAPSKREPLARRRKSLEGG